MTSANDQGKNPMADPARDATDYPEVHPARRKPEDSAPVQTLVFLHGGNVGNWSWDPQVLAFGDFNILTLHLPAFGARFEENWEGLDSAADDVAALIADEVSEGGVHLVGMSLGGVIALHVAARHPELVESVFATGVSIAPLGTAAKAVQRMQLKLIGSEWYWKFQAGAYGMVDNERELFAEHGVKLKPENMRAIMGDLDSGGLPADLSAYTGPALVLAGASEPKFVQRSFPAIAVALPQAAIRVVPGMHHQWNIENPLLFNSVLRRWITGQQLHQVLREPVEPKLRGASFKRTSTLEEIDPQEAEAAAGAAQAPDAGVADSGQPAPESKARGFADRLDPRKLDPRKLVLKSALSKKPPVAKRPSESDGSAE